MISDGAGGRSTGPSPEYVAKTPLSKQVQQDLIRLWTDKRDYLAGLSKEEKIQKLRKTSYKDYLADIVKVDPDLHKYYHPMGQPSALITETTSAWWSFNWGYPGFDGLGLEKTPDAPENLDKNRPDQNEPTQFHFPGRERRRGAHARAVAHSRGAARPVDGGCPDGAGAVRAPRRSGRACAPAPE